MAVHNEDISPGLIALCIYGVIRVDLQLALGAGGSGYRCRGLLGSGKSRLGLVPGGERTASTIFW